MNPEPKKLYRSKTDRILFGVCGGLAKHFHVDATVIRILFVLLVFSGIGILFYIVLALIIPENPYEMIEGDRETKVKEFFTDIEHNAQKIANELKSNKNWWSSSRNVLGLAIIVIGAILLFQQFFPIYWAPFNLVWPIIIIAIGIYFIAKKH